MVDSRSIRDTLSTRSWLGMCARFGGGRTYIILYGVIYMQQACEAGTGERGVNAGAGDLA